MAAAARQGEDPLAFVRDEQLFVDLARDERFAASYTRWLASLHEVGARASIERLRDAVRDGRAATGLAG